MAGAVNGVFPGTAPTRNASAVNIPVPEEYWNYEVNFIASIRAIEVNSNSIARAAINEPTGTIVATQNVRIPTVDVSLGSLTISIRLNLGVSQAGPLTNYS